MSESVHTLEAVPIAGGLWGLKVDGLLLLDGKTGGAATWPHSEVYDAKNGRRNSFWLACQALSRTVAEKPAEPAPRQRDDGDFWQTVFRERSRRR